MYGDFSRLRIGAAHDFAAVWSQQGRVQLDSDMNALMQVMLEQLRTLTVDALGPFAQGWPRSSFAVELCVDDPDDLSVSAGDYYVYGLRARLDPSRSGGQKRRFRSLAGPGGAPPLPNPPYLVELVVWEETLSALSVPALLEPGLGPDPVETTLRTVVRHRIRTVDRPPQCSEPVTMPATAEAAEVEHLRNYAQRNEDRYHAGRPSLVARAHTPGPTELDDGDLPSEHGFRGPENQLYRIEIHNRGVAGEATFVWSRDNASVTFGLLGSDRPSSSDDGTLVVELADRPRDRAVDLDEGDWVELVTDDRFPLGPKRPLLQVTEYDRGRRLVTLAGRLVSDLPSVDLSQHPFLRRWDQRGPVETADNAVPVPTLDDDRLTDGFLELEDGVQVKFADPDAYYRRGDYWIVPARSTTGGVLWPTAPDGRPLAVEASRPFVHRAPLALVHDDGVMDLRGSVWLEDALEAEDEQGDVSDQAEVRAEPETSFVPGAGPRVEAAALTVQLTVLGHPADGGAKARVPAGTCSPRLGSGQHWVGRSQGNAFVLTDDTVSRAHARLTVTEDAVWVEDAGAVPGYRPSSNGTVVTRAGEDRRLETTAASLEDGDVVRFGEVPLRVQVWR